MRKSIPIESYDPNEYMSEEELSEELSKSLEATVEHINNNDDSSFITEEEFNDWLDKKDKEIEEKFGNDLQKKIKERFLHKK